MNYVCAYDIGSMLFFGLTGFFYFYQKRLRNLQDGIFSAMLICSMVAVVFDSVAALMERYAMAHPVWLIYVVNILFLIGMQTCLPLFLIYSIASAGKLKRFSATWRTLAVLPYAATIVLLLLSPFTDFGICTVDAMHIYRHGASHEMLYVNMGVYVFAGVIVLMRYGKLMQREKRNVIFLFMALLFVAMALQMLFPRYLLTASATALALTAVYHVLQSPVDQVEPLTQAFSRTLLPSLLQDYIERNRTFTLLLMSLHSFEEYVRLYGDAAGNALLKAYAERLMAHYAGSVVVFMDTSEFVVVHEGVLSVKETETMRQDTPDTAYVGENATVQLDVRMGAVPHGEGELLTETLTTADYLFKELRAMDSAALTFADAAYKRRCMMTLRLDASIGNILSGSDTVPMLTPIVDAEGQTVLEEVKLFLPGREEQYASPKRLLHAAGESGYAVDYYRTLLTALQERCTDYRADRRLCIPLLPAVFLQDDAPETIQAFFEEHGLRPEQVVFAVDESELAVALPLPADNVRRLTERGFVFMVDTFAEGYTDMSLIMSLPLQYARLHESLIKNAAADAEDEKLLRGLIGVLADVGITAVCPGIDGALERRVALHAGATLLEGPAAAG